jgi:predicted transcriptional regulator
MNVSDDRAAMLISIRPRYVADILAGRKTAEVRRNKPSSAPGSLILIYATTPVQQVVATCVLDGVRTGGADRLWRAHGTSACLSRQEMRNYLRGAAQPTVLLLSQVSELVTPVPLDRMRKVIPSFHPPQTYRFLSASATSDVTSRSQALRDEPRGR